MKAVLNTLFNCFISSGKVLRLSSGVGDLIISLFILLLSWIVGTSFSVAVGVLLTYSGHSLTWYCRPYLLLALYTAPSLLGIGLVHFLIKKSIVTSKENLTISFLLMNNIFDLGVTVTDFKTSC